MMRFLMALCMTCVVSVAFAGDYYRSQPGYRDDERNCRYDRQRSYRDDDQRSYRSNNQQSRRAPYAFTVRQQPKKEPQAYDKIRNHMEGRPNQVEQEKSTTIIVVPSPGYGNQNQVIIRE